MVMPEDIFNRLCRVYCRDQNIIDNLWREISDGYSAPGRYYHTLDHIVQVLEELNSVWKYIKETDVCLFAVFYHDLIYDPLSGNNEEESAAIAGSRMSRLNVDERSIQACENFIMATKGHLPDDDNDINYFNDADLSILGKADHLYTGYAQLIRKEYSMFPDEIYNPSRRKVLHHFLNMERIFKSEAFHKKYEIPARQNIQKELSGLH